MRLTTLVTHVEPGEASAVAAQLVSALTLAEACGARLTALVFAAEVASGTDADIAATEARTVAQVRAAAEQRGVPCQVRARSSFAYGVGEVLADHLRVGDLGVFSAYAAVGPGQRMLLRAAIFDSGRPVLVVPADRPLRSMPARVVVAWDASPAAVRATHEALPFIAQAAETLVLTVSDDKELRSGQSGIELASLLARHGAKPRFSSVQRGSGSAYATLLAAAREAQADLLVMGSVHHSALHQLILGSATEDWLRQGPGLATLVAA